VPTIVSRQPSSRRCKQVPSRPIVTVFGGFSSLGPPAGERTDAKSLQFGTDGRGPDQTIAGSRRGMDLEPAADGEDGPLQFGRDPLRVLVAGLRPAVEALSFSARKGTTSRRVVPTAARSILVAPNALRPYAEGVWDDDGVIPLSQALPAATVTDKALGSGR
jgi:hypothetical protein